MKSSGIRIAVLALSFVICALTARVAHPSDHADPIFQKEPESNITGLFFFPKDDQLILILGVRRALTAPKPYNLKAFDYVINMDLHSKVTFNDESRARYGGMVASPEGISPDVTIRIGLNDDTTLREKTITGLKDVDKIRFWTGVRDDPFIFPRFFKKNVIALALSIPMSSFPSGQQDFLLWATTSKNGVQIDHVGRANRSQLGRFDFLNTLPPREHVAAIMEHMKSRERIINFLKKYKLTMPIANGFSMLLGIRKYDFAPDVMIYSNRFPPGFPNGEQLKDDVVLGTCMTGDCDLYELSYTEGNWPRQTVNDKPFLADWPYVAEPWPDKPEMPGPVSFWRIGGPLLALVVLWHLAFFWLGSLWGRRRARKAA